jgi:hypothetical protein
MTDEERLEMVRTFEHIRLTLEQSRVHQLFGTTKETLSHVEHALSLVVAEMRHLQQSPTESDALSVLRPLNNTEKAALGPLIEALGSPSLLNRIAASTLLLEILPRLSPAESTLIHPDMRSVLHRQINMANALQFGDLIIAILKGIEAVRDLQSIAAVRDLAHSPVGSERGRRVKEAARKCLVALESYAAEQKENNRLLRPVDNATSSNTLLTPAVGPPESDVDLLLHPL